MTVSQFDALLDDISNETKTCDTNIGDNNKLTNNTTANTDSNVNTGNKNHDSDTKHGGDDDLLMFDSLSDYVEKLLSVQRNYISNEISNLKENFNNEWNTLIKYKHSSLINSKNLMAEPRQDSIVNGLQCDENVDESLFVKTQLFAINKATKNYNFKHLYSVNVYLEKLLIRAHSNSFFMGDA